MTTIPLGTLQRVPLREVWSSESAAFTPWLAEEDNLRILGDTLGLVLALEATEQQVGTFRADIVAKDTADGSFVLIENQLERTDHSHLGQLLTYAAGLSTVTIVWIAERFTDEHRAALDWLNENTDRNISLFGLEIELWRIEDSRPAPKFNVVSKPNNWVKNVTSARSDGSLSETKQLQLEFWTEFKEYLTANQSFLKPFTPAPQNWAYFSLGRTYFYLSAITNMKSRHVAVEMVINVEGGKGYFHALLQARAEIEASVGLGLTWREEPDKTLSAVSLYNRTIDPSDRSQWDAAFGWLKAYVEKFHQAFAPRVKILEPLPRLGDEDLSET